MASKFNTPPGWPPPPPGWTPPPGWQPDPSWPAPPADWQFWVTVSEPADGPPPTEPSPAAAQQSPSSAATPEPLPTDSPASGGGTTPPPNGKKRRWKWIAGGLAAVVVIVLAGVFGTTKDTKPKAKASSTPSATASSTTTTTTPSRATHSSTTTPSPTTHSSTRTPSPTTHSPTKSKAPATTTTPHSSTTVPHPAAAAPPPAIAPITLSGSGQQVSGKFTVAGGLTEFTSSCNGCTANFAVQLLDATGNEVDLLANTIGAYTGTTAEGLPAGEYQLNVTSDTAWSIVVSQPRSIRPAALPQAYNGKGDSVVGPFDANGPFKVDGTNSGQANFAVKVINADGEDVDLVFNEIGNFTGSNVAQTTFTSGPYYLVITSDGTWRLALSNP